jgi:hypothetical protein
MRGLGEYVGWWWWWCVCVWGGGGYAGERNELQASVHVGLAAQHTICTSTLTDSAHDAEEWFCCGQHALLAKHCALVAGQHTRFESEHGVAQRLSLDLWDRTTQRRNHLGPGKRRSMCICIRTYVIRVTVSTSNIGVGYDQAPSQKICVLVIESINQHKQTNKQIKTNTRGE